MSVCPKTHFPQVYCPSTEIRPRLPRQKLEHIYLTHKVTSVSCPLTEAGLFSLLALYQMEQNIISACFAVSLQSEHPKPGGEKSTTRGICVDTAMKNSRMIWIKSSLVTRDLRFKCKNAQKQIFYPSIAAVLPRSDPLQEGCTTCASPGTAGAR